jgi:murein DD-endopeptidase MepM/ murein hydrolase activator NlpD
MNKLTVVLSCLLLSCGKGGDFISGSGVCEGYAAAAASSYKAPWPAGKSRKVVQGNCGGFTHTGTFRFAYDIEMPIGSPILAARDGDVVNVVQKYVDGNGCPSPNEIWIRHNDGTVATYLHLTHNGALVSIGDVIVQGKQIGWSGKTGCATDAHLHFEVKANAQNFDAYDVNSVPISFANIPDSDFGLQQGKTYTPE